MISGGDTSFRKLNTINRRMFIISAAKVVVFTGIVARLFSLQINENKKYLTLSDKNRLREWKLPPERGEFLDFYGNTVAGNLKVYQLHVVPEQVEDFKYLMVRLKDILQLDDKKFSKIIKKKNKQKPWETLVISENLSWDQFSKVNFYLHELGGAKPVLSVARNYPYKENFTHVLGYVAQASESDLINNEVIKKNHVPGLRVGKIGLEKAFENDLIGSNGIQRYEVNAYGKRINQIDYLEGKNLDKAGYDVSKMLNKDAVKYHGVQGGRTVMEVSLPNGGSQLFYKSSGLAGKSGKGVGGTTEGMWQPFGGFANIVNGGKPLKNWFIKSKDYENFYGSKSFRDIAGNLDKIAAEKGIDMSKQALASQR